MLFGSKSLTTAYYAYKMPELVLDGLNWVKNLKHILVTKTINNRHYTTIDFTRLIMSLEA